MQALRAAVSLCCLALAACVLDATLPPPDAAPALASPAAQDAALSAPQLPDAGAPESAAESDPFHVPTPPPVAAGVVRCGAQAVCVPPTQSAQAACELVLPLLAQEERIVWQTCCGEVLHEATSEHPLLRRAALLRVSEPDTLDHFVVVLAGERGFDRVTDLLNESHMSITDTQHVFPSFVIEDVLPGGAPELRVEMRSHAETSECSGNLTWLSDATELGLCTVDGADGADCFAPIPLSARLVEVADYHAEKPGQERVLTNYRLDVRVVAGKLAFARRAGHLPRDLAPLLGQHTLVRTREILARAATAY